MPRRTEVWIVCRQPAVLSGVKSVLRAKHVHCELVPPDEQAFAARSRRPDVLLTAPACWSELCDWLPALKTLSDVPWLFLGNLRVAGLFFNAVSAPLCTLVSSYEPTAVVQGGVLALAHGRSLWSPALFRHEVERRALELPKIRWRWRLTDQQMQLGCALALGLQNPQIAEAFDREEKSIRNGVNRLRNDLRFSGRAQVGEWFDQAVTELERTKCPG